MPKRKIAVKRYENKLKLSGLVKNKFILKASAFALLCMSYLSMRDEQKQLNSNYIHELIKDFYTENNKKLITKYPHIPIEKYSKYYQL